jgi:tRNA(adenine34) deaminase
MAFTVQDCTCLKRALELAAHAKALDEVPVGAVLVSDGCIIGEGWNGPISTNDPTAHAEIMAIRNAAKNMGDYRLPDTTLYVTLEPCIMCAGAMVHARIKRLVFGAFDPRMGAVCSVFHIFDHLSLNHRVQYEGGLLSEECERLLKAFFQSKRSLM